MNEEEEDGGGGGGGITQKEQEQEQQQQEEQQQHEHEPNNKAKRVTRLAFGSCHKNRKAAKRPNIWDAIGQEENLDGWIWTGDAMYPSSRDPLTNKKRYGPAPPIELKNGYDELRTNTTIGYQSNILQAQIPTYGTWDDHDYGGNDMGLNMMNKDERKRIFFDFLDYKNPPNDDHPGVYHSIEDLHGGDLQLILLDTRWFRQEHCIKSAAHILPMGNAIACATRWLTSGLYLHKIAWLWGNDGCQHNTVLGQQQWDWLESTLLNSQAKVHVIVSSIQVWTTNPAMESWGQFPTEQQRLHALLNRHYQQSPTSPVIMLSGDVHHAEIINSPSSGLLEVTSSGLTHHCGQPFGYGKLCQPLLETFHRHRYKKQPNNDNNNDDSSNQNYYIGFNYGVLTMDDTTVTIQVKDASGKTILQVEQPYNNIIDDNHQPITIPPYEELPHTWDGHLIPLVQGLMLAFVITLIILRVGGGGRRR